MSDDGALWAGRFSVSPAPEAAALGRSLDVDLRLAPFDVRASIAHVGALLRAGLLDERDAEALREALTAVAGDLEAGRIAPVDADEDVHSVVERAVTERLGEVGERLHAGRSRNDLVVTDLRLWLLAAAGRIGGLVEQLVGVLVDRAREHAEAPMPGTTHGRLAQPVTAGHQLLAYAWGFARDLDRLDAWAARSSTSALGAGAIATSTLGLDPAATASELGFAGAFENSIDAVGDRDFAQEFVAVAAIAATHASRLAADLARWTDPTLGWAELDEAYSTGSSMMPQKRNPDTAELVRAKAGRIAGAFVTLTSVLQGLPAGYHRDLQEDKAPVFDAAGTLELVLPALTGAVRTVRFDEAAMRAACEDGELFATDVTEALVAGGMPFRAAHRRTGELLKELASSSRGLRDLTSQEWTAFGLPGGASLLDPDRSVRARAMPGGPSPASVQAQIEALTERMSRRGR